ncbi:hypothetical protein FQR65_LT10449 [Abscondita terminalis]|nr:hypothetical protein FQR65_LT10449 [Abscondita terminalis]
MGHVDSGKTTLAKVLSQIASTAAFDKNPQSKQRGITLELGFSSYAVPSSQCLNIISKDETVQFTLVDCPGHAGLIRTVIGGAQIIDLILLVVDVTKGMQTQTAECIVIGEITSKQLIVVLNKIDLIEETIRTLHIEKMKKRLMKNLSDTLYTESPIVAISAQELVGIPDLISKISETVLHPKRNNDSSFVLAVDHCFSIKGKGTVLTGTVLQGTIKVDDEIELPAMSTVKKVKSIQIFKQDVTSGSAGDRLGVCVTQFNPKLMERGIGCKPGYAYYISCGIISANKIKYFKEDVNSRSKYHITVGYETVLASIISFECDNDDFNFDYNFKYTDKLSDFNDSCVKKYLLLQFERPVLIVENCKVIGSKLDLDKHCKNCRLAFAGSLISGCTTKESKENYLSKLKIYKEKMKVGRVDRILNDNFIIVKNLAKNGTILEFYKNLKVTLSNGDEGVIRDSFGQSGKVKVEIVPTKNKENEYKNATVTLVYKKYVFVTNNKLFQ